MNDTEKAKEQFTASGELRSFVEGNLSKPNNVVHPHLGLAPVDSGAMELMNFFESVYQPVHNMPYKFSETAAGNIMTKATATKEGTKAVKDGNISQIKYITGQQYYGNDVSGIHTLQQLEGFLEQDAYIAYLFGHMGNGKTDFAMLQAEIYKERFGGEIATNVKSFEQKDQFVQTYGDLLKWLANGTSVDSVDEIAEMDIDVGDKLFIFDEASSHASGYAQDAYETQMKLGTLTKKIRKVGGNMIIIGHTGKDVHPDIRRVCNHCIDKIAKKEAVYYKTVNDEGNGIGDVFSLDCIPQTNYNYDTNEITYWDWTEVPIEEQAEVSEKAKEKKRSESRRKHDIAMTYLDNDDMTMADVGEMFDVTRQRVSQIVSEYRDKEVLA